jgi:hypothetical protein
MTITPKSGSDASGPDASDSDANDSDASGSAEDNSEPTSLLLIKSEAGWRIRDLFRS